MGAVSRSQLKGLHRASRLLHAFDKALLIVQRHRHVRRGVNVRYGNLAPRGVLDGQIHSLAVPAHQRGQVPVDLVVGDRAGADQQRFGVVVQARIVLSKVERDGYQVHMAEFLDLIHHPRSLRHRERRQVDQVRDASRKVLRGPARAAEADERVAPDLSTVRMHDAHDGVPGPYETRDVGADEVGVGV